MITVGRTIPQIVLSVLGVHSAHQAGVELMDCLLDCLVDICDLRNDQPFRKVLHYIIHWGGGGCVNYVFFNVSPTAPSLCGDL